MVRNAGKFGKPKRGGKKQFTQNLAESDRAGMWDGAVESEGSEEDGSEGSVEESEESESGEEEGGLNSKLASTSLGGPSTNSKSQQDESSVSQTRAERKAAKKEASGKSTKTAGNDDENSSDDNQDLGQGNSNRVVKKSVKINEISNLDTGTLNRKEREAAEKKAAQERYWKLHQAGKTDEAKVDMARLAKIRQEREQAAAFRKAEAEAKAKEAADRAALSGRKKK
ncbi:hypothetical protein MJO28_009890 [Puccinia striiformis f. sp. tritici]|uniref:Casein kinase substrate phosphoprotein PP28 domain-containing protein n=4 Tax=Puccinia striiformis TaxID=27350 RepID=A0A0L0VNC9_9BASI|nr:hypothetical protein Pst134EB_018190 [Puccinia striiformis f. sp. tritici]KAI9622484.1 hypothetical protein H4Q26_015165 [Puccinia striiformis f. sp. tritici PST-130]KNF00717.1 hypothetical protein PSTG_06131 [Puccinia striiformis f. sp. tritici PST-78]POW01234.1 hypothetical protein PSHT_12624 [Puccinia striiformis]KAI7947982.1 hypothetical protein MJO28_009890 [Puccinia striiformis f. sp. tritici]